MVKGKLGSRTEVFLRHPWLLPLSVFIVGGFLLHRTWRIRRHRAIRWIGTLAGGIVLLLAITILPLNLFAAGKLGGLKLGPIPEGTPVNLLVNLDAANANPIDLVRALLALNATFGTIEDEGLDDESALAHFENNAADKLLAVSKNPDFVRDRGHYFGTQLSDEEKEALIAFLKRF